MKYVLMTAVAILLLHPSTRLDAAPPEPLVDQVRKAIDNGKKFLRDQQVLTNDNQGHWEVDINSKGRPGGWTALALLALLNSGERPDAPVIQRGLKYLRGIEPVDTYVVSLQTMVFAAVDDPLDKTRIQRNVDWLVKARLVKGKELRGWGYSAGNPLRGADNSNTHFAVLGLWAGQKAGATIQRELWESVRDYYLRTQDGNGSWYYADYAQGQSLTMTTAGVCSLNVIVSVLGPRYQELQKDGVDPNCGIYPEDRALAKANSWITQNFAIEPRGGTSYHLYGMERVGWFSGLRFVGDHDWYREGCLSVVRRQHENGSWYVRDQLWDSWPIVSTSFALMFLSQGRIPVLLSKLQHGSTNNFRTDWNRKRRDMCNLTEFASKELFKRQPLAWQIFNVRQISVDNDEEVRSRADELLQSPIAFFNGHYSPVFTDREIKMLRHYVEQGGFILAEACCGSPQFDRGFRRLMNELFPKNELVPLGPSHPVWQSHNKVLPTEFKLFGIEMGNKTAVVYSPEPLSGWWEANQTDSGRGQLAFRLGANIIAYATGKEMPKPKGSAVLDRRPNSR